MTDYNVVLLVEQALSSADATQIHGLHEDIEDPVRYHVLLPVEDAAAQIESGIGALATGEVLATPALLLDEEALNEMRQEILDNARAALASSVGALTAAGARATGEVVSVDPIEALAAKVTEVEAAEAIVLTRPHVVSEFFHLDWSSRARRKLGVPVLHLLEHESFDEQAEHYGEEGITGL